MQNATVKFLVSVRQEVYFNAFFFFFACPIELDAVLHIQNIAEKENINVEKMFTSKLKPSHSHRTHIYCIF